MNPARAPQSVAARLAQIALYGVAAAAMAGLLTLIVSAVLNGGLTRAGAADALGWGALILGFLSGAVAYSQSGQNRIESTMRARLGDSYRVPGLPWPQILIPLIGAGVLSAIVLALN